MSTENDGSTSHVVIPAGTEKNLFGSTQAFKTTEQVVAAPDTSKGGETTQANSGEGAQQGTTFAELAAKKGFKTADDLAKAYGELEVHATKKSMELSELATAKAEGLKNSTGAGQGNGTSTKTDYSPDEALAIVGRLIDERVAPIQEQLAIRETFKNQDDMQFAPAVAELVRKNPSIPWDVALKAVKYDTVATTAAEAKARKDAETNALREKAQAGSSNQRIAPQSNLGAMISDKNVPFKEVQKAMREQFSQ